MNNVYLTKTLHWYHRIHQLFKGLILKHGILIWCGVRLSEDTLKWNPRIRNCINGHYDLDWYCKKISLQIKLMKLVVDVNLNNGGYMTFWNVF